MRGGPVYTYRLRHRRAGTFGSSTLGRTIEWVTSTWLRFEVAMLWLVLTPVILGGNWQDWATLTFLILASPVLAIFALVVLKIGGWVIYFVPGFNVVWGWSRIAFFWTFSRLIVEETPEIEIPAWSRT